MTDFYFDVRRHDRHRRRQSRPSRRCSQSRDLATSRGPTVQGRSVRSYISIRTERPCTVDPADAAKSRDRLHPDTGRHRTLPPTQCTDATTPPPTPPSVCSNSSPYLRGSVSQKKNFATQGSRLWDNRTDIWALGQKMTGNPYFSNGFVARDPPFWENKAIFMW